ncbi:TetR/AcrR family transcriptional regulator [Silvimonas iriomotensis]|uniref:TetR family transcriptional regulator n=1 Tax=Silvimonas iriomotensis TaxID=449662 RepID=A0ABQ2PBQ4_9NEIS|nr:TetR/AcrR family transcriptional regulator [Silvimonas iriomotensis]GGP22748.1 TetR family transcriptional regulator [Silvimonas iriomotensis]
MTTARKITDGVAARNQILDAAEELFYFEGSRTSGVDAIVKKAGVNKMSLYRQFESKDDLLRQYLDRRDETFWRYINGSLDQHPGQPRRQLEQLFDDLSRRTQVEGYRGCPFVNIAVEYPERSHFAREMVAQNKAGLLARLTQLSADAGAQDPVALGAALALLIEGTYAGSQTYAPGNPLLPVLPQVARTLIGAAINKAA